MARFRTEADMFPLIEQWQSSEQTQKAFCAAHDISVSVLAYWLRRYRDHHADPSNESGGFIAVRRDPVQLSDSAPSALEVRLPSGVVLRFGQIVPVGYLKALL